MASNLTGWTTETLTVYEYVLAHPGATGRQVADVTGMDRSAVNSRLDNLVAQRYLDRELSATRGGGSKYTPSASSPATPPPASKRSDRPRPPKRPKWVGPITTSQETPDAVRPRKGIATALEPSPAGSMGEPQQTAVSASPARDVEPLHSPAATPPPDFTLAIVPIDVAGWREEDGEIVKVIEHGAEPAPVDAGIAVREAPMLAAPPFTPDNRAGAELTIFNCKIDEAHGPEASIRGYCARCERLYGPIA